MNMSVCVCGKRDVDINEEKLAVKHTHKKLAHTRLIG